VSSQPTPSAVDITPLALAAEHRRRAARSTAGARSTAPAIYPTHTALDSKPAARRCCWRPEYGARNAPAALQQYILPTGRSTANPPLLLSNDGTDRQTDGRTDGRWTVAQTLPRILCGQCKKQELDLYVNAVQSI